MSTLKHRGILLGVAILAGAVLIFLATRDSDERRIRRRLKMLAEKATNTEGELSEMALVGRGRAIQSAFTKDCVVSIGRPIPDVNGPGQLATVYLHTMKTVKNLEVTLHDVTVAVDEAGSTAVTYLTVKATSPDFGQDGVDVREIEMKWRKVDDSWRIEEARVVHPPR
jgi:hypothetical protein